VVQAPAGWSNLGVVLGMTPLALELSRRWVWRYEGQATFWRHAVPFLSFSLLTLAMTSATVHVGGDLARGDSPGLRAVVVEVCNLGGSASTWLLQYAMIDRFLFPSKDRTAA
jgi:hypothetical protein